MELPQQAAPVGKPRVPHGIQAGLLTACLLLPVSVQAVSHGRVPTQDEELIRRSAVELLREDGHYCSGTLVDPMVVLTAFHCFQSRSAGFVMPVALGFFARDGSPGETRAPSNARLLRRYADRVDGDLALILLDKPAPTSSTAAGLYEGAPAHHAGLFLSGSGLTETGGFRGLLVADMVLGFLDGGNFVASDLTGHSGGCPGDSGGGAFIDDGGSLKLVGVNSTVPGAKNCSFTGPVSLASVPKDREWILRNVARLRAGEHGREGDSDATTIDLLAETLERSWAAPAPGNLRDLFRKYERSPF